MYSEALNPKEAPKPPELQVPVCQSTNTRVCRSVVPFLPVPPNPSQSLQASHMSDRTEESTTPGISRVKRSGTSAELSESSRFRVYVARRLSGFRALGVRTVLVTEPRASERLASLRASLQQKGALGVGVPGSRNRPGCKKELGCSGLGC